MSQTPVERQATLPDGKEMPEAAVADLGEAGRNVGDPGADHPRHHCPYQELFGNDRVAAHPHITAGGDDDGGHYAQTNHQAVEAQIERADLDAVGGG